MSWEAIEALDESIEDTKEMLTPFSLSLWTKLGVIAILTGGIGAQSFFMPPGGFSDYDEGVNNSTGFDEMDNRSQMMTGMATEAETFGSVIVAVFAIGIIGFIGVMLYVTSVFEFIYYQSLLDKDVRILDYFSENTGRGFGYFGFQIVFGAFMLGLLAVGVGLAIVNPVFLVPLVVVGLPLMILAGFFTTLVHDFALVDMLKKDKGMIDSISRTVSDVRADWKEYGIYLIVKFVIGAAYSIYSVTVGFFAALLLAIPFVIIGLLLGSIGSVLIIPVALIGILTWLAVMVYVVMVPAKTFIFFYAINVYERLLE